MSQLFLTNYSVVVIQHVIKQGEKDLVYKLGSQSLIRSEVFFTPNKLQSQFENHLFFVQTQVENTQFKIAIQFESPVLLRHKLSNKYLSYSTVIEDEESDSTIKLQLSTQPCYFRFMPCFQYQTKISTKIKFYEDIYLATQLSTNKLGYVVVKTPEQNQPIRPMLRLNFKSKLILHCYSEIDAEDTGYFFGQSIWLKHVESKSFLKNMNTPQKEVVLFQQLKIQDAQQCIKGLWLIDAIKIDVGGILHFNEHFYLKNLCVNKYLTFSKEFKLVNGEKVHNIKLTQRPSQQSRFIFESLKGEDNKIKEGSYLILKHVKSQTFVGTRRSKQKNQEEHSPFLTFTFFQDEDLYTIDKLANENQQIYRFIFSFRDEFEYISRNLNRQDVNKKLFMQFLNLYENIYQHLEKLSNSDHFIEVQEQIGSFMANFFRQLSSLRNYYKTSLQNRQVIVKLLNKLYQIMKILSQDFKQNQIYLYDNIHLFIPDIFQDFGAEELISQIFTNNYSLLCKLPNPLVKLGNSNLINTIFQIILSNGADKGETYWRKMIKIFQLLDKMIYANAKVIDINQRLISVQLFEKQVFDKLFFQIQALNRRIKIKHPIRNVVMELDQVKEQYLLTVVQRIMKLFSELCQDRNFISKSYIHNYLNKAKQNGVEIIITYLNIPISPNLSNHLYSLITNCYIDSSPRINRKKPLPVILFNLKNQRKLRLEDDLEKSGRLQSALLNKTEFHYKAQPFQISNLLTNLQINQPSLTAQELDLYKQQLNERLNAENWSTDLLKSINILIQLESYSITEIEAIKESVYSQIMKKKFSNDIIPFAMHILQQMDIYCQQLEIKKITTYLKYCFVQPKKREGIKKRDIEYLLPDSRKIQKILATINQNLGSKLNEKIMTSMVETEEAHHYREEYNEVVTILKKFSAKGEMRNYLFQMFTDFDKVDFSILKTIFSEIIRTNFPKLRMMQLVGKSIVITGEEVQTFQQLFEMYKKINHLNCISEHWLYSKTTTSNEHKHFIEAIAQFTNYMFEEYELNSKRNINFRKKTKLNINRQLLLKNMAVHQVVLDLLSSNYYILEVKSVQMLEKKQKQTFEQCFTFLYYFCQSCDENLSILSNNLEIFQKYRDLVEVGQTKLLILMYKQNPNLLNQISHTIIEKTMLKIVKSTKGNYPISECQYNPKFLEFLQTACFNNGKVITKNIEYIHAVIQKESVFKRLLFVTEQGKSFKLCLSISNYKSEPLCVPILYHRKLFKIFNILIQNLESFGTQMRNKLKQFLSIQDLFKLLSLPDIYSHNGVLPQLYFLLKKELVNLLSFYLDKNDSLNKLYESRNLQKLLDHFVSILIIKPSKITLKQDNQQIMLPYLEEYKNQLRFDLQNQRDYYNQTVHPLLSKIYFLFEKMPNRENNTNFKKINQILESLIVSQLSQNHLLKNINYGIDLVDLKWRNFVDADADNSEEEKFTKRAILELLMHQQTYKEIKKEEQNFYEQLSQREEKYFNTMQKFIQMASEEDQQESQQSQQLFYQIIKQLAEYLEWVNTGDKKFKGLEPKQVIETLISYVSRSSFDYNKQILRETFYHIIRIFLILLEKDEENELPEVFYEYFKQENSCYRFFQCLSSAINQIFDRIEGQKIHEQINFALRQLSICGEKKTIEVDKKALKFIKLLCKHIPFTEFFRNQTFPTVSIDFLEKLFNVLFIMLKRNEKDTFIITISNVDIAQEILDCMQWMLNGCNEANQNYLIDTKFPSMVVEMLKKEVISPYENKADQSKRDMLLQQVVSFYESNGINIKDTLLKNIKYLDFKHIYLLNRLKLAMLKLLHQCTLANDRGMNKIKIIVPVQLLKINLIWTYNDFKEQKLEYSEENVLKSKESWRIIVEKEKIEGTFLMVGFYFYVLIEQYKNEDKDSKEDDQGENIQDEQKQKEKIVKRFFSAIIEKDKKNQKMKSLQKEPFGKQMVQFYKSYYAAHSFYRSKTLTVEAKVYDKLIKIYFPLLPICESLTDSMKKKMIDDAERISHQQKIKSLMGFQQQSYELIDGQETFYQNIQQKSEVLYFITRVVQDQHNFFFAIWVVSCLIVLNYLLYDYMDPKQDFNYLLGTFITPTDFLSFFMLVLQMITAFCGLILLINLVLKKIPFLVSIHRRKYEREKEENEEKGKTEQGFQSSFGFYILANLLTQLFFDIYIIVFSFLTIIHPVFAGFQLVYIISRIEIGQLIIQAIKQTAFSLFAATGLLIVFNYVYSVIIYIAFTDDVGYGGTCQNLFKCLLMVFDQSLKGDAGFLGYATRDDTHNVFTIKLLSEIFYILFVKKVIFEIFSGTIIDKFSQLREKSQNTQQDQESNCYICGQQRFEIDFQLQGFEDHVQANHNKFNYVYYIFYLRKKKKIDYGIEQNYIWNLRKKQKTEWIPDGTSLLKEEKNKENAQEEDRNFEQEYEQFFLKKMQELKKIKQKMQSLSTQLNDDTLVL